MKKSILILVAIIGLTACGTKEVKVETVVKSVKVVETPKSDFPGIDNPSLFGGKDGFGKAFLGFIVYKKFDMALKFTSKESIDKFGVEAILSKYKSFKFSYNLNRSSEEINGKYTTLRYKTHEIATGVTKDFVVIVENDSCKLVLPEKLEDFLK